jgi:hypothetical protein
MACHQIISRLNFFLQDNTYNLVNYVHLKATSLQLHTTHAATVPLFEESSGMLKFAKSIP